MGDKETRAWTYLLLVNGEMGRHRPLFPLRVQNPNILSWRNRLSRCESIISIILPSSSPHSHSRKRDIPLLLTPTSQQTSHSRSHRYYPLVFLLIAHKTGGDEDLRAGAPALMPIALNSDVLASDIVDVYVYGVDR
jgi:hypothetical protein